MTMVAEAAAADVNGAATGEIVTKDQAAAAAAAIDNQKKSRIQVSNTKKPLFFYVNLAKRYLQQHKEIELSALGMAITTVVTISEILKNNGFVNEKSIKTSTVGMKDANKGRTIQKARIEIILEKSEKFESLVQQDTANNNNNNNKDKSNDENNNTTKSNSDMQQQ